MTLELHVQTLLPSPVPPCLSAKKLACSGIQGTTPTLTCSLLNEMLSTEWRKRVVMHVRLQSAPSIKKQALRFWSQPSCVHRSGLRESIFPAATSVPSHNGRIVSPWGVELQKRFEREEKRKWPRDSNYENKQLWLSSKRNKRDSD